MKRYQWAVIDRGLIVEQVDEWSAAIRYAVWQTQMALLLYGPMPVWTKLRVRRIEVAACAAA